MKQIHVTASNIDQVLTKVTHDSAKDADELQEQELLDALSPDKLLLYMNDILAGRAIRLARMALVEAGKSKGLSGTRSPDGAGFSGVRYGALPANVLARRRQPFRTGRLERAAKRFYGGCH
jgi:hypothetical protein